MTSNLKAPLLALQHNPILSWTDDLPVCDQCGYGSSTNQVYRQDGFRREAHDFEDRSFHFNVDGCCLYGVFDGHDGSNAAHFAEQRIPAELLLGQLTKNATNEDVQDALLQAFEVVEKGFFDSIDDMLAAKAKLQLEVPDGVSFEEIGKESPELAHKIKDLEYGTGSGCTATLALIHENKLYVANCGNSRVLLCRSNPRGDLRVTQLTMDHTIWDPDEQSRLSSLGADMKRILERGKIGNMVYTRCIGDYKVKMGHKDISYMRECTKDPVSAIPYISDGIEIDESCQFLILMTDGLYTSLQDAKGIASANAEIAGLVAAEYQVQTTLNGVAQAVVDRVVRIHHDTYMTTSSEERKKKCQVRDDLTLLVRNFNRKLPSATSPNDTNTTPLTPVRKTSAPFALSMTADDSSTNESSSTIDSTDGLKFQSLTSVLKDLAMDDEGKVGSYVNFDSYFEQINNLSEEEKRDYEKAVTLVPSCPPIHEHDEEVGVQNDY